MANLDRKRQAISRTDHPCWLHYRTLEPFILSQLARCRAPLLDLGCGNRPYRDHYPPGLTVGADVQQSSLGCVDVILDDSAPLPFADAAFETVLCSQVLEHVEDPCRLLAETCRVLRPGGRLILSCPFIWALHERPHDYLRFSEYWLRKAVAEAGFSVEVLEPQGGDFATIGQLICLTLDARRIHLPRLVQKIYNRFWAFLDRRSPSQHMPLNYGIVCIKTTAGATREAA